MVIPFFAALNRIQVLLPLCVNFSEFLNPFEPVNSVYFRQFVANKEAYDFIFNTPQFKSGKSASLTGFVPAVPPITGCRVTVNTVYLIPVAVLVVLNSS